jgi:hypothetical protein
MLKTNWSSWKLPLSDCWAWAGRGAAAGGGGGGDSVEGDEDAGRGGGDGGVKEQMMREVLGRLRAHILQVLCIVTLYCNFTRALTFEIFL